MPGWSHRLLSVAAWLVVFAGGCRFHADYDGTDYRCSDGVCPAGQVCVDGFCVAPGGDVDADPGAADASGGDIDGAVPVGPCGLASLLADDFDDGVEGPQWNDSYENGVTVTETGGRLVLTIPGAGATGSGAYITDSTYDLRGSRVTVELVTPADTSTVQEAELILRSDTNDRVILQQIGDLLQLYYRDDGTTNALLEIPFSASDHRFWAIAEQDGTLTWETSPDGSDWTVRHLVNDPPIDLSRVQIQVGASDQTGSAAGGTIRFDNVNGGEPATGAWCAASTFTDNFEDGVVPWSWSQSFDDTGCSFYEELGVAVIDLFTGDTGHCAFYTAASYDLRDDAVSVEIARMVETGLDQVRGYLRAWIDSDNFLDIMQEDGTLYFRAWVAGAYVVEESVSWSLATHRHWRIRETAGRTYWETSADGVDWMVRAEANTPLDVSAVQFGLGAQALVAPATQPGEMHFDRFNLP
jgi:hypothetical protein